MKKSIIAMWIVAALFLVSACLMFAEGNIGAGVCGIVIAAALAFVGYSKNRKAKESAATTLPEREEACEQPNPARKAAALEEAREPEPPYEFLKMKVAGVTFKDGRQSRQTMIRRLYWKDDPFDKNEAEVTLQREEYEGKPAFTVLLNDRKIGYVPAEHAQYIADNFDLCDGVTHIEAYSGKNDIYGAEIVIRFRKA